MTSPSIDRRLGLTGNKAYKAPCDVATTSNVTLSGEQTIDGVVTSGSRVLVWNQSNSVDNGIWDSSTGSWSRAIDCNTNQDIAKGTQVLVTGGTSYAGQIFEFTSANPIIPGTSAITIVRGISSSTLEARLASTASAADGSGMVGVDFAGTTLRAILSAELGRTATEIANGVTPVSYLYPPLNALRYGADPTGVASSTTAFANMMLSVPTTGGECIIPPGTYNGKLVINRNHTTVRAKGAKLVAEASNEVVLMQISGGILVSSHLYDAQIDGNGGTYTAKGVKVVRAVDCNVEWCKIDDCKDDGIMVTGDGVGASTHVVVKHNRVNAHASRLAGAYGINISGEGVNAATRLYDNYCAGYDITVNDAGVNTVDLAGIGETGTSYTVSSGGDGVFIGNWIESGSYTGSHFVISDSRTSIYSPHDSGIANVATGAVGQFPAKENRIIMKDGSVLGAVIMPDTGLRHYNTAAGGTLIANSPGNMRGSFQIAGANTTATITFSRNEANTSYFVSITATAKTGAPAAGANRVVSVAKATTGFVVTVEAAPGGATDVSFDWIIVR